MTFQMWSVFHILFILSPFIAIAILYIFTHKLNPEVNRIIGIIFSSIAVLVLVLRNIEIFVQGGYKIQPEIIPLQICHFANFVMLFAFIFRNKTLFTMAFCFNLPAAFLSIVFADSLVNYSTILNFRGMAYIWGHMLIVAITIWAYLTKQINIDKKSFLRSILIVMGIFVLSVPVNNIFNNLMPGYTANYFYTIKPENGTPLEMFFNLGKETIFLGMKINFVYVLVMAIVGGAVLTLFYVIAKIPQIITCIKTCLMNKCPFRKK